MSKVKEFFFSKKLLQIVITINIIIASLWLLWSYVANLFWGTTVAYVISSLLSYFHFPFLPIPTYNPLGIILDDIFTALQIFFGFFMLDKLKKTTAPKTIPKAWKIVTLLFCSRLCGILLLIQRDNTQRIVLKPVRKIGLSPLKKLIMITLHAAIILMVWLVPCARYGRVSWGGLEGSNSTTLGNAISSFASYDSSEAAILLLFLVLIHIFAVLFLIFACIGKFKVPIVLFSCSTLGFTCLLNIIAAYMYETVKISVSNDFWNASVSAYEFDDGVTITIFFALIVLVISLIMTFHQSAANLAFASAEPSIPVQEEKNKSMPIFHDSPEERLTQLNRLKENGLITEEEYNEKKQSILNEL